MYLLSFLLFNQLSYDVCQDDLGAVFDTAVKTTNHIKANPLKLFCTITIFTWGKTTVDLPVYCFTNVGHVKL